MIRPIPSGHRNFELEWYPFGNDVQTNLIPSYRVHHGIDLPNETGTPILAASSGTVIHAGTFLSPNNGVNYYGNTVVIQHDWQWNGQDVFTLYAHTLELFVEVGDRVEQGQLIAGVGSSGEVSGPHLHFEVRVGANQYSAARNPALWMAPYEGWGTIAGRFIDRQGNLISSATLTLISVDSDALDRHQQTYYPTVGSDPVWRENFVFADVPAGNYELIIDANDGAHRYKRDVEVRPGQTSFELISTNFTFVPTATPLPTSEPTGTPFPPLIILTATPEG
jgi:murein DD-endopeptidase MepM/ murein hydrolase activator NlpD